MYIVYRSTVNGTLIFEESCRTRYDAMRRAYELYERNPRNIYSWSDDTISDADAIKDNAEYIDALESRVAEFERTIELLYSQLDDLQYRADCMEAYIDGAL